MLAHFNKHDLRLDTDVVFASSSQTLTSGAGKFLGTPGKSWANVGNISPGIAGIPRISCK